MADTRDRRQVVSVGKWKPYTHPEHGEGAVREIRYIDGTIERRFAFHGTVPEGEQPDAGYVVDTKVDPELRKEWETNKPAADRTPAQIAADEKATREEAQRKRNRELPPDQDPADETDEERRKRADARIKEQGAAAKAAEDKAAQDKKEADAKAERDAANNRGTTALKPDGKGGTIAVTTYPDGRAPTTAPVPGVPSEASAKYVQVKQDPQTGKWHGLTASGQWEELQGGPSKPPDKDGFAVEPAGAPPLSAQYGAVSESLGKYRDFLNEQVRTGALTPDAADKLMAARLAQAKTQIDEQENVVSTQRGVFGDQRAQRSDSLRDIESRRNAAKDVHGTVMTQFMPLLQYMPQGGGQAFLDLLQHGTEAGVGHMRDIGGLQQVQEIQMGPAATAANQAGLPGQGSFMAPYQPPAAPVAAPPSPPNAIGLGGPGAMFTPGGTPPPAVSVPGMPSNVVVPAPGTTPPVNPMPGQPGSDPNAPIGMAPPQQGSFMTPYSQPTMPSMPGLQMMIGDPGMSNDIVARAYRDVFGHDLPMPGMIG